MFNQKLQATENIEFEIAEELRYETDPCELKLDEMIEAEPEPEMIEGLPASDALTPADRYLELFEHVQSSRLFTDSKTFPDCAPKMDPLDILIRYRKVRRHRDFDLRQFVENHFWLPETYSTEYVSDPGLSLKEHIDSLWPVLTREPQDHIPWSSLLALPQAYIVPGGRFSETYYWDSYFSMLGLAESGRNDLLKCMADNFAWLIERYGHIPNGNRTYYLSRSQPPVFALMVELFEEDGVRGAKRYLEHLKMEYAFWMDGAESLLLNQPTAAPCVCRTARCSTATGMTVIPRAMNRGLRTWKLPAIRAVRQTRCIATCAPGRRPAGTIPPAGCAIRRGSPASARRSLSPST